MRDKEDRSSVEEGFYLASQWQLMWRKFKKHKLAMFGGSVVAIFYIVGMFCGFFSPYDIYERHIDYIYCPPQRVHFFDEKRGFHLRPFVYAVKRTRDMETLQRIYKEDKTKKNFIYFLVRGDKYKLWNLFPANIHLFGLEEGTIFLFGTDL